VSVASSRVRARRRTAVRGVNSNSSTSTKSDSARHSSTRATPTWTPWRARRRAMPPLLCKVFSFPFVRIIIYLYLIALVILIKYNTSRHSYGAPCSTPSLLIHTILQHCHAYRQTAQCYGSRDGSYSRQTCAPFVCQGFGRVVAVVTPPSV
jgi:hypothetical protein